MFLHTSMEGKGCSPKRKKVREERWSGTWWQACLHRWTPEGRHRKLTKEPGLCCQWWCAQPLGVTTVAHGWQSLYKFGCQAEAQWSFEITALCNKDPCSPQQEVSAHWHCCVKLHQEARQLGSQSDHLTSHMSHVHETLEAWYIHRRNRFMFCFGFFLSVQMRRCNCSNRSKAPRWLTHLTTPHLFMQSWKFCPFWV